MNISSPKKAVQDGWNKLGKKGKRSVSVVAILSALYGAYEPVWWLVTNTYEIGDNIITAYSNLDEIPKIREAYARDTARIKVELEQLQKRIDNVSAEAIQLEMVEKYCQSITEVVKGELDHQLMAGIHFLVDNYGNFWYYRNGWLFRAEYNWESGFYEYIDFTDDDKVKRCR